MYLPQAFRQDDPAVFRRIATQNPFAMLVTSGEGVPFATHLPFLYEPDRGPHGALLGHVARANPHWRALAEGQTALVVFQGPHAYVSPSWYAESPNVPTWNYVVAHAYGRATVLDEAELSGLLETLVETHETRFEHPWSMTDLPAAFTADMLRAIVGFRVVIERVECKLKLSQNRQPDDQRRVASRLAADENVLSRETARWMEDLFR